MATKSVVRLGFLLLLAGGPARSQTCVDVSTGFDQDGGAVIGGPLDVLPDDDYTIDTPDGSLGGIQAFTVKADGFPIPPWIANDAKSRWIGFDNMNVANDSEAPPGVYLYTIVFIMPADIDASKAVLIGGWATDDPGLDVEINGTLTGFGAGGFGGLTKFPPNFGIGLFAPGENTIVFKLENGGGPTGLRVSACVGVPVVTNRLVDLSTGFDEGIKVLLGDDAPDDDYQVTGPEGSGIGPGPATCIADDDFPIPPWFVNSVGSRWVGPAAPDGAGPAGSYRYKTTFVMPATIDAALAALKGLVSAAGSIDDILVNGLSSGITFPDDPTKLQFFPVNAGQGLFKKFSNTIEILVSSPAGGPTGLRVDAEVVEGRPPVDAPAAVLRIDTGYDDAAGALLGDLQLDDNYVVIGPPDSDIGPEYATTVAVDGFPIPPWIPNSCESRWIGLNAEDSSGPGGTYTYRIKVNIPPGFDPGSARLVGGWATDDPGVDIIVNGASTGIGSGGFGGLTIFGPEAGKGLFQAGDNELELLVSNGGGPTGLRVEAVVGFEDPRPGELSTGVDPRGIGKLPGGLPDSRYVVTGPEGSGIGPRRAFAVKEDGSPIPPWAAGSDASQWIGIDGSDSIGPAGTYTYEARFCVGSDSNPYRLAIEGSWAAAGSGADVVLGGTSLGVTAPGPAALAPFPAKMGLGLIQPGENVLQLEVSSAQEGSTGLRVEARLTAAIEPSPLDISTGFDEAAGQPFFEGDLDDSYVVTDPLGGQNAATVLVGAPIPPWVRNADTSKWIGVANATTAPGPYVFEITVDLETDEAAAAAYIQGVWAVDDQGTELAINDATTGIVNAGGFANYTAFPPDAGKGFFAKGPNVIRFTVLNAGTSDNPAGLRVDAVVAVPSAPPAEVCGDGKDNDGDGKTDCDDGDCAADPACKGDRFHRGDADDNGQLQLTDAIRILGYLFLGAAAPACLDAADADDNGQLQLTDAIRILGYLFLGGSPPAPPGPPTDACGPDPSSGDDLGCEAYTHC
ncbi:MAG: hypothetical protein HY721_34325 [Planctomycetes bacterium]|nr:hypothetical protein [Planctomycetota bacterium]